MEAARDQTSRGDYGSTASGLEPFFLGQVVDVARLGRGQYRKHKHG